MTLPLIKAEKLITMKLQFESDDGLNHLFLV